MKRKVLVMLYNKTSLGGPSNAMKKIMESELREKYEFEPYYFLDKLGKIPRFKVIINLVKVIKANSPDIVYFTGLQLQGFYVALSCWLAGYKKKTVMVVRGSSCDAINISKPFYLTFRYFIEPLTLRLTKITHTVCTEMANKELLKKNARNFGGVIYNIAPLSMKDTRSINRNNIGLEENDTVLIYTGRLIDDKGIPCLLDALSRTTKNQKLLLVGDGPHRVNYEQICRSLRIENRVEFLGNREDVFELLAASDIYVFPTLHENLSNSLLEACTMKLPVIATNVGGNPEVIQDGIEGILVNPGDPEALRLAIDELTENKAKRLYMSKNAFKKMVKEFAPSIILKKIDNVFESIK